MNYLCDDPDCNEQRARPSIRYCEQHLRERIAAGWTEVAAPPPMQLVPVPEPVAPEELLSCGLPFCDRPALPGSGSCAVPDASMLCEFDDCAEVVARGEWSKYCIEHECEVPWCDNPHMKSERFCLTCWTAYACGEKEERDRRTELSWWHSAEVCVERVLILLGVWE